ncbi:MAG: (Fe-S)-binding protein, partial [bacterium]
EIIERCNGSGVCRKEKSGTMCPSFMVTRDEKHSTRGRANTLRGIISGNYDASALTDGRMQEVMDLCISCKACKSECPSEVDMAPLKQEVQHKIHEENGASIRERFFAGFGRFARLSAPFQPIVSWLQTLPGLQPLLKKSLGIAPERSLPVLVPDPVTPSNHQDDFSSESDPVVLYADTFSGYLEPSIFRQAHELLKSLGLDPIVPDVPCCGRTFLSQGFLGKAKQQARKTIDALREYPKQGVPILTIEPSCYSALVDDYPRLVPGEDAEAVASGTHLITEFLNEERQDLIKSKSGKGTNDATTWVHGHCHEKALLGEKSLVELLSAATGGSVEFIDSGCCGMAGSFGYEREHYELSKRMAERKLIPAVEQSNQNDRIVAPGLSCREQIRDFSAVNPDHPIELLNDLIPRSNEG